MPRISRLTRTEVSGNSLAIYDRVLRDRGNVPNMFRTMAHRPQIFDTIIAHMDAVLKTGTLSTALKELVIVRTSQLNCTEYCLASHTALAKRLGGPGKISSSTRESAVYTRMDAPWIIPRILL